VKQVVSPQGDAPHRGPTYPQAPGSWEERATPGEG